ncbi:hypothetical protein ACFQXB_12445 [Plastorhodobacter daqingensis]|uniref:DUF4168 domain-containing protein n=1 Tax=Plastorhodobacter daqingensis TaxID=1387281 RepID=A0ABW2UP62_9RHOB
MTVLVPVNEAGSSEAMLSEALLLYRTAAEVFALVIEEARDGDARTARDAQLYAKEFQKALQTAMQERQKVEQLRRQDAGIAYDYALDFQSARDEIGRRMARLRSAGGGG